MSEIRQQTPSLMLFKRKLLNIGTASQHLSLKQNVQSSANIAEDTRQLQNVFCFDFTTSHLSCICANTALCSEQEGTTTCPWPIFSRIRVTPDSCQGSLRRKPTPGYSLTLIKVDSTEYSIRSSLLLA